MIFLNLPTIREQAEFKEVVLAAFDHRLQPTDILQLGQELAEKSGYGIDFAKLKKIKEGEYLFSDAVALKCFMCLKSEFKDEDFSAYDKVVYLSDKKIQFGKDVKFPKNMDVSKCDEVNFNWCDLQGVQSIRFKDGAKDEVKLSGCDLSEQPNLCFKEGAKVDLSWAKNLPSNLDFSICDEVDLSYCNLSEQPHLRFKDGARVDLREAKNLPRNLDFSMCDEVDLHYCNLRRVQKLVFKNREQMKESGAELPYEWNGKLVFTDEQQQEPPALGLAMSAKVKSGR